MIRELLLPDLEELIGRRDWKAVKEVFADLPAADIADLLEEVKPSELPFLFRLVPSTKAVEVFSELDSSVQKRLIAHFADNEVRALINNMEPDDRTALLEDLPGELVQRLVNMLDQENRKQALELLGYPEESVGRLMTPDYVAVRPDWSIPEAFDHIREYGRDAETIDMIYVVDGHWKLLDDIPIRRFILADAKQSVVDIMDWYFISIEADRDREEAYKLVSKYNLAALPVVDRNGVLLGIVTVDDLIDVAEEEVEEDFQKVSAISPLGQSYAGTSALMLYRRRVGWLMILLLTDFLSSSIIAHYENAIKAVIALAFFIPVLIDSGGNIAAQSSTLVIRALATGELSTRHWFRIVRKELVVAVLIGVTLGLVVYLRGFVWRGGPTVGLVVGLSMMAITVWSDLLGSLLPVGLTNLRLDPAVISSPLLTTIVDSTGLLIYFWLAKILFRL